MAFEAVVDRYIEITPGVAGGKPRISGHRITVQDMAIWYEWMGRSADEIATEFGLTLSEVHAALAYYYDHRASIDEAIRADQAFIEQLRRTSPSKLPERSGGR